MQKCTALLALVFAVVVAVAMCQLNDGSLRCRKLRASRKEAEKSCRVLGETWGDPLPSGYVNIAGSIRIWVQGTTAQQAASEDGWLKQLSDAVQSQQIVAPDSHPNGIISNYDGMSQLTYSGVFEPDYYLNEVQNITVEGTWKDSAGVSRTCRMAFTVAGMMCPNTYLGSETTEATCAACTAGFVNFDVGTMLLPNHHSACAGWFVRADSVARAALSMLRARSYQVRVENCMYATTKSWHEYENKNCVPGAGAAAIDSVSPHSQGELSLDDCKELCSSTSTCDCIQWGWPISPTSGHCFLRKQCVPDQCDPPGWSSSNTYIYQLP